MKRLLILVLLAFVIVMPASAYTLPINWSSALILGYQEAPHNYSVSLDSADAMCDADPNEPDGSIAAYGRTDPYQVNWWPTTNRSGDYSTGSKVGEIYHALGNHSGTEFDIQAVEMYCTGTMYPRTMGYFIVNGTVTGPVPVVDFTGVPLNGTAPLTVSFTDNSTNWAGNNPVWNWSISPKVAGNIGNTGTNQNQVTYFTVPGNYSVTHGLQTDYGSDILTKTDYITVTNASGLITAYVSAIDQVNGYRVLGSDISIYDVENTSWSNSTADPDGMHQISTIFGHHLNAYASAFGYTSGENLGISNIFNNVDYPVYMTNPNTTYATAGNVTLNIRVEDGNTLQPIAGAAVSGVPNVGPGFNIVTDSQGIVNIVVPNETTYGISATKTNYIMGTKNIYTGTAPGPGAVVPVFLLLYPSSVTQPPSVTQTTVPGGGTPQPTQTYLKYCDPLLPDYNEDACRTSENTGMMDQLREAGPSIIGLCIVAILMGLLKIIMG